MSRGKVGYPFKPLPEELPLIWQDLDLYPRLIIQELWRMSDGGLLKTRIKYLVRDMRIAKKGDRGNAQTAVATLTKERLLKESSDGVRIAFELRWDCVGTTEVGTSAIPTQAKSSKSLNSDLTDQRDQIKEERREQTPPDSRDLSRDETQKPVVVLSGRGAELLAGLSEGCIEPSKPLLDPKLEARTRELEGFVCDLWKSRVKPFIGKAVPDRRAARSLAEQCLDPELQAERMLDERGLVAGVINGMLKRDDQWLRGKGFPLAYATKNVATLLGELPTAPKPPKATSRDDKPAEVFAEYYAEWKEPEWQHADAAPPPADLLAAVRAAKPPEPLPAPKRKVSAPPDSEHTASMGSLIAAQLKRGLLKAQSPDLEPLVAGAAE